MSLSSQKRSSIQTAREISTSQHLPTANSTSTRLLAHDTDPRIKRPQKRPSRRHRDTPITNQPTKLTYLPTHLPTIALPYTITMCYQLMELYSACRCLYYQHAIDRCAAYGRPGHDIQQRTIYVGYACSAHTGHNGQYAPAYTYSDSGYQSGRSSTKSYR